MSYGRVREQQVASDIGYYQQHTLPNPPTISWNAAHSRMVRTTADTVGARHMVNPFTSNGFRWDYIGRISGSDTSGLTTRTWVNYIPQGLYSAPAHLSGPTPPTDSAAVVTAAARSNPGRPRVGIPVFLAELRDLPKAVKMFGNLLDDFRAVRSNPNGHVARKRRAELAAIRDASGYYLGIEFGFKPLISDLRKLLAFQAAVAKTARDLERLNSKGGLRRNRTVFTDIASDGDEVVTQSANVTIRCNRQVTTTRRKWVTMRWVPDDIQPVTTMAGRSLRDSNNRQAFARAIAGGTDGSLDSMLTNTWNALPWTWLADWFGNVGDYLQAHSNAVPCKPTKIAVMYSVETRASWSRISSSRPGISGGGGAAYRWSHNRAPGVLAVLPSLGIPFLSGRQTSILAALFATRHRFSGR